MHKKRCEGASHSESTAREIHFAKALGVRARPRRFHGSCQVSCRGVNKFILAVLLAICAFALYFYAHHNWHPVPAGTTIDGIIVEKSARKLSVIRDGNQIKSYRIALGRNPVGAKQKEGDMKTPEGIYKIDSRNAQSNFHLALHISYPSNEDNHRATARGVSAGSDIMIHGIQNGRGWIGAFHRWKNWTAGCIALTDEEIEELWRVTPDGTTIEIRP